MKHTVISEADKPGMTLDQLQAAVERARRSGAKGNEIVRARTFGRAGSLRTIAVDLDEPLLAPAKGGSANQAAADTPAAKASDKRK